MNAADEASTPLPNQVSKNSLSARRQLNSGS